MSLLSSTQGTPERIWSLIAALEANGGLLERDEATELLNPGFTREGKVVREKPDFFNQTLGAGTSLGAIEIQGNKLRLSSSCTAKSYVSFCDWVHERLLALDSHEKDAVVLETYAWVVVESDRSGSTSWVYEGTADAFADAADKALPDEADDDGTRRMNSTKLPAWRRWLVCLGLMIPVPLYKLPHPSVDQRAAIELKYLDFPQGKEINADDFLNALARRLPYIDRGKMFSETAKRIGHAQTPRRLSPLLSSALRNLHDDGAIELCPLGDASRVVQLSPNATHKTQSFHAVIIKRRPTT